MRHEDDQSAEQKSCGILLAKAWNEDADKVDYLNAKLAEKILKAIFK
ncbi:hypothetical protein [Pedobacter paludis]|nr:hypothetical protein [Pedobacter paludis]